MNYLKVFVFSKDLEFRDSLDFFIVEILHSQNSHTEKIKIRFQLMLTNTRKANRTFVRHSSSHCKRLKAAKYIQRQVKRVLYGLKPRDVERRLRMPEMLFEPCFCIQ